MRVVRVVSVAPLINDAPPNVPTLIIIARIIRHHILINRVHLRVRRFLVIAEFYVPERPLFTSRSCSISICEDVQDKVVRQPTLGSGSE